MKTKLTNEQNIAFMNDTRRIAAQNELDSIVNRINASVGPDKNTGYYLNVLPMLIKELDDARKTIILVETLIEEELKKRRTNAMLKSSIKTIKECIEILDALSKNEWYADTFYNLKCMLTEVLTDELGKGGVSRETT